MDGVSGDYCYVTSSISVDKLFFSRHFTREALPRLDNYRNILSIQAAYRPTLDELHNATLSNKVRIFFCRKIDIKVYFIINYNPQKLRYVTEYIILRVSILNTR